MKRIQIYFLPALLCAGIFVYYIDDGDIWWHLQIGRDILYHQIWPSPDLYSYTTGEEWVVHSWLADCIFYIIHISSNFPFGTDSLYPLYAVRIICLTLFALMIQKAVFQYCQNQTVSYIAMLFACYLCWEHTLRPYILSPLLCLPFYFYMQKNSSSGYDGRWLPVCMAVWCNIHGEYIVICAVFMLSGFIQLIKRYVLHLSSTPSPNWIISIAILLASFINPHPYGLLQRIVQANTYPTSDWFSILWWIQNLPFPSVPKFIIYVVILLCWLTSHRYADKEYWFSTRQMLSLLIFYLAFAHYRMGWLLCFPMMDAVQNLKLKIKPNQTLKINAILVIYIAILLSPPPLPEDQLYKLPISSIQYIQQNGIKGNVYCPWTWSGYVTWKTDKKCQVFLDTRIEPFDRELIELHFNAFANPIPYFEHIKVRKTRYILYPSDLAYEKMIYLSKIGKMTMLHKDNTSFLAEIKQ